MANSRIRITGGTQRGMPLAEPRGLRLRPTTGKVREAIFNVLGDSVQGVRVLDCYAGTGALGIEALSRGAGEAVFIDAAPASGKAIVDSLSRMGLAEQGSVLRGRLPLALGSVTGRFTIVFMDPPYDEETAEETLVGLRDVMEAEGMVVYEHGSRYNPPKYPAGLELQDRRVYGDSAVAYYRAKEEA